MKRLSKQELMEVNGGAIKWAIVGAIAAGVSFIIGVVDGIIRPLKCN